MSFSSFVARRYFRTRKKTSAVGIITLVATFGVAVAVFAMFVVLSVFSGLRALNAGYFNTFDPDLTIRPAQGKVFTVSDTLLREISSAEGVEALSCVLEEKVFVSFAGNETVARLKGVDTAYPAVADVDTVLVAGGWLPVVHQGETDTVWHVAGISLAYRLGMASVDRPTPLRICVLSQQGSLAFNPEAMFACADTWTAGVFSHRDYDGSYLFADIGFVRRLLHRSADQVSALEVRLSPKASPERVAGQLGSALERRNLTVRTAAQNKEVYYKLMNTENLVLYFVFTLVIALALFNVGGSVVMLVLDKRENIRTMWALGADRKALKSIFIRSGMSIVGAGALVGLALAVLLVWLQARYHWIMIEGGMQVPYPVELTFYNAAIVVATILSLGYLATRLSVGGMKNFFRH